MTEQDITVLTPKDIDTNLYTTEYQVIIYYNNGKWDLPTESFIDIQTAIEEAEYFLVNEEDVSHCVIELQVSANINSAPETLTSVPILQVKKN